MKRIMNVARKGVLAIGGVLGGCVVWFIVMGALLHVKVRFGVELPTLWLLGPILLLAIMVLGLTFPQHFMHYFLCPVSWLLSANEGQSDMQGGDDDWKGFIANALYFIGLVLFAFGVLFTLAPVAGAGLLMILSFTTMLIVQDRKEIPQQKPNDI